MELCNAMKPRSEIDWAPWIPTLVPGALTAMRTRVIRAAVDSLTSAAMRCGDVPLGMEDSSAVADDAERPDRPIKAVSPGATEPLWDVRPSPAAVQSTKQLWTTTDTASLAVSRAEAGKMLSVSWRTIERMVNRGQLRALKVLGQWRIPVSEIHAYMRRQMDEQAHKIGR